MKKILSILVAFFTTIIPGAGIWAQETSDVEFTLEEITVTAEKRAVNAQELAMSIDVLAGDELAQMGRITTAQILEAVPNLTYRGAGGTAAGGIGDSISIRGVKKTQNAGGGSPTPSTTSAYVDDVYGGIGGTYDINRVEVLRGPQGTLYGRSATGGVVAFHTNDPKLDRYSADISVGYSTGARINTEAALNAPIGGKVALRAAVHYLHQDEGYFNGKGGENETKEGRIKALFQPNDNLNFILSLSGSRTQSYSGGWSQTLTAPNTIEYKGVYGDITQGVPTKDQQGSLHVNYDFGDSTLTYIAAMRTSDNRGKGGIGLNRGSWQQNETTGEPSKTQTHEIRWESDSEGYIAWLIGSSYYKYTYDKRTLCMQVSQEGETREETFNAMLFKEMNRGTVINYGLFTEETFDLRDDFLITVGLRYDRTSIENYSSYDFNTALYSNGAAYNPPNIAHFPDYGWFLDDPSFNNITYKLRFEYDLTPENMIYALTATGFLPGDSQISMGTAMGEDENGNMVVTDVYFHKLPYEQQKLTSYEIGTKNRFLEDKLQLNGAVFYYDYEGYQEAVNIKPGSFGPPPEFIVMRLPVRMYGLEVDGTLLLSPYDKLSLSGGWLDAKLKSYPDVPSYYGGTESAKTYMYLKEVPGLEKVKATLGYDHTFLLGNGSTLVPRAEARYSSGYYLNQATYEEAARGDLPYIYVKGMVLGNISASWNSPNGKYSAMGYIRNVFDKEYKTGVSVPSGPSSVYTVTVGDPRTWGVTFNAKF